MTHHCSPPAFALALLFALVAAGCAAEGVDCGTIRCAPDQLCVPPNQPCVPLGDGESCAEESRCWIMGPLPQSGCYGPVEPRPGWCLDVSDDCGDVPDCDCVRASVEPYRCLHVTDDGYVLLQP
jgi:hypothetical protein